jgi:hypothetical protein
MLNKFFRKLCILWNMWKNLVQPDMPQMAVLIACWIPKATDTHSEYVIFIVFSGNSGYANAPHYYVYTCISSLLISQLLHLKFAVIISKFNTVMTCRISKVLLFHDHLGDCEPYWKILLHWINELHMMVKHFYLRSPSVLLEILLNDFLFTTNCLPVIATCLSMCQWIPRLIKIRGRFNK